MTYQSQADLAVDAEFGARLGAALTGESRGRPADPLAKVILNYPQQGVSWFMPFTASAPTFADKYAGGGQSAITDADLLSAVQADWAAVTAVHDL